MKGVLIVTDAIEGVHVVDVTSLTEEETEAASTALTRFLDANVDGTSWVCNHPNIKPDLLPRAIRVWPDLNAYLSQYGVTFHTDDDDDDDESPLDDTEDSGR